VALSGCAQLGLTPGGGADWAGAALQIAKDPACSHTDVLDIMLGAVPSGHVHLERSGCKTGAPAAPPAKSEPAPTGAPAPVPPSAPTPAT
jgi:hypothetical protein